MAVCGLFYSQLLYLGYLELIRMKHLQNDTTAGIATAITGSSAIINFAQTWQPVVSLVVGLVGIVSGIFAIRYYSKKINGK